MSEKVELKYRLRIEWSIMKHWFQGEWRETIINYVLGKMMRDGDLVTAVRLKKGERWKMHVGFSHPREVESRDMLKLLNIAARGYKRSWRYEKEQGNKNFT